MNELEQLIYAAAYSEALLRMVRNMGTSNGHVFYDDWSMKPLVAEAIRMANRAVDLHRMVKP